VHFSRRLRGKNATARIVKVVFSKSINFQPKGVLMKVSKLVQALFASALALSATAVLAQAFPSKPLTMIVAFPAGGASDQVGRVMAKAMGENLSQNIIVENVVGAGGSIGALKAINAAADGHTLIAGSPLELILTPLGIAAAKNKPEDVRMIALAGRTSMVLVTRKDLGVNTFEEFVALVKKTDKPLSYASTGVGSLYHLMGEKFTAMTGGKTLHVPFNGLAPMMTNLVGGQVDFAFAPIAGPVPGFVDSAGVKALAVSAPDPVARLARVPTIRATKGFEDFVFSIWAGVHTGAKVSDATAATLHKSAYTVMANPDVRKSLEAAGMVLAAPMSLQEVSAFYAKETAAYQAIAKAINLQAQ
jgi:tripartite-type tricarboxylate transporter receptor subunit TctC